MSLANPRPSNPDGSSPKQCVIHARPGIGKAEVSVLAINANLPQRASGASLARARFGKVADGSVPENATSRRLAGLETITRSIQLLRFYSNQLRG
jgi:hypothetical protein